MRLKGSLILEASYIFPLTIISIFLILLLGYYKHDYLVIKSGLRTRLIRQISEEEIEEEEFEFPVYYMSYQKTAFEKNGEKGELSTMVDFDVFPKLLTFDRSLIEGRIKEEYKAYRPQKNVRRFYANFIE